MIAPGSSEPSLKAFMDNFCASRPHLTKESVDTGRDTMTQPHCYWTLTTPYAILIGLYTNVVEGGELDNNQIIWLHNELVEAKKNDDKALILTMHQPVYSYGRLHGGSEYMYQILEDATKETGKRPDMVVAGHDHNYQRFTRTLPNNQQIPYLVAGGGGHWLLDTVKEPPSSDSDDVKLIKYVDGKHGYLRLTVSSEAGKATEIRGDYITVPSSQMSWRRRARVEPCQADSFILNLTTHQVPEPSPATAPPPEGE
jgi:acid phosphatase type 7